MSCQRKMALSPSFLGSIFILESISGMLVMWTLKLTCEVPFRFMVLDPQLETANHLFLLDFDFSAEKSIRKP
jgi:hypothetical protein